MVARDLGLEVDLDLPMTALSGGEAARVGLAALLLSRYDVYLLDEPTNDLDAEGLGLLEAFVARAQVPIVVVSHDREFLSRTVTTVVEIDRSLQRVLVYGGSYDAYLEERSVARRRAREAYEEYAARRSTLEARARRQRAWMAKGVRNARRKATDHDKFIKHRRAEASREAGGQGPPDRPDDRTPRGGRRAAQGVVAPAEHRRGTAVGRRGERRAGRGGGAGRLPPRVRWTWRSPGRTGSPSPGPTGRARRRCSRCCSAGSRRSRGGWTSARGSWWARSTRRGPRSSPTRRSGPRSPLQVPDWPTADVRTLLAKFGLGADHVGRAASSLSPGERTRAALALLQARGVNLLVLDEPTNHLDLPAIEQLEAAMDAFDGTILLVTHDRRMLETVRLTRRLHVEAGEVVEVPAD